MRHLKRLLTVATIVASLLATFGPVAPTYAVSCTQLVYFYRAFGAQASGGAIAYCVEEYPLIRTPPTWASFEHGQRYNNGSIVDNSISSLKFAATVGYGYRVILYQHYNFNPGPVAAYSRLEGGSLWFNVPESFNNTASSFAGCGTDGCQMPGG